MTRSLSTFRPRRTVLYLPGSNARAIEKSKTLPTDCIIFDLEDAVAPDAKLTARHSVCDAVKQGGFGSRETVIRINSPGTPWAAEDLLFAASARPDAILLPKVNSAEDILQADRTLTTLGVDVDIWAMLETPLGVMNALSIASCKSRLKVLVMGTNDLSKETRSQIVPGRGPMSSWLSHCLLAARCNPSLCIIDGVYNSLDNGFVDECIDGRQRGFDGKTVIHPSQLADANRIFSPTLEEVQWAEKVVKAWELPENASKGVLLLEGRMVERLHLDMALRVLGIQQAINHSSSGHQV